MPQSIRYVAFGSNLHPVRLGERVPSARVLGIAEVGGYALRFWKRSVDGSAKATLVNDDGSRVQVAIYEMTPGELPALDRVEGCGSGYDRIGIDVPGYDDCFTYQAPIEWCDKALLPYTWYRELVLVGCEYHGFPVAYIDFVRGHDAIADADSMRHARNMRIAGRARINEPHSGQGTR